MGCLDMIQSLSKKKKKKRFLHMHHMTIPCGTKCGGCQSFQSPSGAGQEGLPLIPSPLVFIDTVSMLVCCPCFNIRVKAFPITALSLDFHNSVPGLRWSTDPTASPAVQPPAVARSQFAARSVPGRQVTATRD